MSDSIPNRFAGTYVRELVNIDPTNSWYGYKYFGQFNRKAYVSAQKAAEARWKTENNQAKRSNHKMGLLFCIKKFGKRAFRSRVLEWRGGDDFDELQLWVDPEEIRLIAEGGGPFRGLGTKSTLNLTHGGQGAHFASFEARNAMVWEEFCNELLKYEAANNSTLVPRAFVSESGYKLGKQLAVVRRGQMWKGTQYESERRAWLESKKRWHWNAKDSEEWRQSAASRSKARYDVHEFVEAASIRTKEQWANAPDEIRKQWCESLSKAHSTPQYIQAASVRKIAWWTTFSEEARQQFCQALSDSHTPESIAKQVASHAKNTAARHDETRSTLEESQLEEFEKKLAENKASVARRQQQLEELRKIPGWEHAKWEDLKRARDAGVIANGRLPTTAFSSSYEQQKHQLSILRKIPGWEKSNHADLKRARDEGVMPDLRKQKRPILATAPEPTETPPPAEEPKPEKKPLWWLDSGSDEEDEK
jgi:hypothetical protein